MEVTKHGSISTIHSVHGVETPAARKARGLGRFCEAAGVGHRFWLDKMFISGGNSCVCGSINLPGICNREHITHEVELTKSTRIGLLVLNDLGRESRRGEVGAQDKAWAWRLRLWWAVPRNPVFALVNTAG